MPHYVISDGSGRTVGRAGTKAAAHRATRRVKCMGAQVQAHNTAIIRNRPSAPMRHLVEKVGLIKPRMKVLDFGCGRGEDVDWLLKKGVRAKGWDPHEPFGWSRQPASKFQVVTANYVVNTIPSRSERITAIKDAWGLVDKGGFLVVTSRPTAEISSQARANGWSPMCDGFLSSESRRTFQKGHDASELRSLLRTLPGATIEQTTDGAGFEHAVAQKAG